MIAENKRALEKATRIELENFAIINEMVRERFEKERAAINGDEGEPRRRPTVAARKRPAPASRRVEVVLRSTA